MRKPNQSDMTFADEPFALVGEHTMDGEKIKQEKLAAEQRSAEAKKIEEKQQHQLVL